MTMPNKKCWFDIADAEVSKLIKALPAPLRDRLANVSITLSERPSESDIMEDGDEEGLLGLFIGFSVVEVGADAEMPPEIRLFIENICGETDYNVTAFRQEVRVTLLHEIGHYLGLDEDSLELRGLG